LLPFAEKIKIAAAKVLPDTLAGVVALPGLSLMQTLNAPG
jgi:hypothetical protein